MLIKGLKTGQPKQFVLDLVTQAQREQTFARDYKKNRVASWKSIDRELSTYEFFRKFNDKDTYYTRYGVKNTETRSQVPLFELQSFAHTLLSKIDAPLTFKYLKGENADETRAKLLNALKDKDQNLGRWNYKDLLGKQDAIRYGRAIYYYNSSTPEGYRSQLKKISSFDFYIDPDVGGVCGEETEIGYQTEGLEKARYMGWKNVKLTRYQLKEGAKNGTYYKSTVKEILDGKPVTVQYEDDKEEIKKETLDDKNIFRFWAWFTHDEDDVRYYLLFDNNGRCIRADEWKTIKKSGKYPIWTWAALPEADEFWSASYCEYALGVILGKEKSINQMLDNAEQINRPQKAINIDYIRNPAQVRYKRDGIVEVEGNVDVNRAIQTLQTPSIDTPLTVYDKLNVIIQDTSGVTAAVRGTSEEEKVGIYQGNLAQAGDRFGLLNKSYAEGYYRLAILYKEGVMQDLNKKVAVKILGVDGMDIERVTKRELRPSGEDYDILVESSMAEAQSNTIDAKNRITFLSQWRGVPIQSPQDKLIFEESAKIAGFDEAWIKSFIEAKDWGESRMVSNADEVYQLLLDGKRIPQYKGINTTFVQRLNDDYTKTGHELNPEQEARILAYIEFALNEARKTAAQTIVEQSIPQATIPQENGTIPVRNPEGGTAPEVPIL